MKKCHILLVGTILLFCPGVYAGTINVPADQPTIQAGINAAVDWDTVLVAPGVYSDCISFMGKRIIVLSSSGRSNTEIVASQTGTPVVSFTNGEQKGATISGFTIRGGSNASGVLCVGSSPTIVNNIITGNTGPGGNYGGGITLYNTTGSVIKGNVIHDNKASGYGGAIHIGDDGASSTQDTIAYNVIYANVGFGDIRTLGGVTGLEVSNNTISVSFYCGIYGQGGNVNARNNIIFGAPAYGMRSNGGAILAEYNCTFGNAYDYNFTPGLGNIYEDAMFTDTSAHDYRLPFDSPCIDAGDPAPQYNDPDGSRNDMGAVPSSSAGVPYAGAINYGPSASGPLVFTLTPMFCWSFFDTAATSQTGFEIEVGTDVDWAVAEMWSSGSVMQPDTSVTYGGLPLSDLQEYYLRIRLHNGIAWGSWVTTSFFTHTQKCIHVPSQRPTIQAGINAAVDGDTVLVAPGTYLENLSIRDKGITLLSSDGRTNTTLKPLLPAIHLVAYTHCSSKVNVFKGFTLANVSNVSSLYAESCFVCIAGNRFTAGRNIGDNDYNDGTATLLWGNFIVKDNVFDSNQVGDQGGGVMLISQDSSLVEGNIFFANFAKHGGGIAVSGSKAVIRRNLFISNTAAGYGGAIFLCRSSKCMVYNNTIDSCASLNGSGGGAGLYLSSRDTLFNNIMAYCTGYSIWQWTLSGSWAAYNDCYEGTPENYHGITEGTGSISLDPQFVGGEPFDYDLKFTSPCINTGNPEPAYNDPDGSRNDMGAYPFSNHAPLSFALLTPANATSVGLATLRPLFSWDASVDPDTGDVVTYDLVIATDSNFSFVQQILNLATTSYTLTTDLQWGQQYFWNARASDGNGGEIWSPQMFTFRTMTLGDANNDAIVGIADVVFLIDYIFAGGAAPQPLMTGDPNCNGRTNIGDVVYLINYIFLGGPAPCDEWK